jgi:hypothetical protein
MKRLICCVVAISAALALGQFEPLKDIVFTETKAVALMPPLVIGKGTPKSATWSPDGELLFVEAEDVKVSPTDLANLVIGKTPDRPVQSDTVLSFFNLDKQLQTIVWKFPSRGTRVENVEWMPGNRTVLFTMLEPVTQGKETDWVHNVYAANATTGKAFRVLPLPNVHGVQVFSHPKARGAVVLSMSIDTQSAPAPGERPQSNWVAYWIGADGRLGSRIKLQGSKGGVFWGASGDGPYTLEISRDPSSGKQRVDYYLFNFAAGTISPASTPAREEHPGKSTFEFELRDGQSMSAIGTTQAARKSLWLASNTKSERQFALVSAEMDQYSLSPASQAVFYTSKGIGMVRPLASMPKDAAMKALEAAERNIAMNHAKQAGLGLMMYAADYDDMLPGAGDITDQVLPYVKNREILDGFFYTFGGGSMADIENPAQTEIGYRTGPNGRAVVYADGHVKWIPNPAPVASLVLKRLG